MVSRWWRDIYGCFTNGYGNEGALCSSNGKLKEEKRDYVSESK